MKLTKTIINSILFLILLLDGKSYASPWAPVGDISLRNDVEVLAQYGVIVGPVNTWPISWKQITTNLSQVAEIEFPPHVRNAIMRVRMKVPYTWNISTRTQITNNSAIVKGFQSAARNDFDVSASLEFNGENGTTAHFEGGYRAGNSRDDANIDGSYISQDIGNWSSYVGLFDRWWGPGRESTLILSNNARPMPSVGLRRIEPKAFESNWLKWIGPWQWDMFVAKMEKNRYVPNALFVGMRLSMEPLKNFELGLSRTLQLCGEGRPCGFNSWTKALISVGDLDNPEDRTNLSQEPGNQLASIDAAYSAKINELTNVKLYIEGTAEDLLVIIPYEYAKIVGISFYGPVGDAGASWRFSSEFSDTISTLAWFGGRRRDHVLYNHHIYKSGYRYKGRAIGHTLDTNSQLFSLNFQYTSQNDWDYSVKYHRAIINKKGDKIYTSSIASIESKLNMVDARISAHLPFGELQLSTRIYDNNPITIGAKDAGIDGEISWIIHY